MNEHNTIIRCSEIHKSFSVDRSEHSRLEVLTGIDLDIHRGDFVSIVGASGSGKSTLLHILGGLDRPTSGTVYWGDEDIFSLSDETLATQRARNIGFVFQFHHLMPEFSAMENIMIPSMILGLSSSQAESRARELLSRVGLLERQHHRPNELSGGEQQRVAVARALANTPAVIFADEPSGNLDSGGSEQLHDLLIELNRVEGQTFVVVTHNDRLTEKSTRVFRMFDGKLNTLDYGKFVRI